MLLFAYILIISTQIFKKKILTSNNPFKTVVSHDLGSGTLWQKKYEAGILSITITSHR